MVASYSYQNFGTQSLTMLAEGRLCDTKTGHGYSISNLAEGQST
jgi:hypothetical protein